MADFGECTCGGKLTPIWFTDQEVVVEDGVMHQTGRIRRAVSHLTCEDCMKNYPVDDSFDEPWRRYTR